MTNLLTNLETIFNEFGIGGDLCKIIVIVIMCTVSSLLVLISHVTLYEIFAKDLLKIGGKIKPIHLLWCLGAVVTYMILYFLNLVSYTLQSIIVVSFTWNFLLESTFDRLINKKPKDVEITVSEINNEAIDDFK